MSADPDSALSPDEREHRRALGALTLAIRRLCDASVSTRVDPPAIDEATRTLEQLCEVLEARLDDGPYSGLMAPGGEPDMSDPHRLLPLSPVVGPFNPIAPDLRLRFEGDRVKGNATLGKKHVGPPDAAHGGVGAMLADQLVALVAVPSRRQGITRELRVRYRRPTPLYRELELEAWVEDADDEHTRVHAEIRCEGRVTLEATAEMVNAEWLLHPDLHRFGPRGED